MVKGERSQKNTEHWSDSNTKSQHVEGEENPIGQQNKGSQAGALC